MGSSSSSDKTNEDGKDGKDGTGEFKVPEPPKKKMNWKEELKAKQEFSSANPVIAEMLNASGEKWDKKAWAKDKDAKDKEQKEKEDKEKEGEQKSLDEQEAEKKSEKKTEKKEDKESKEKDLAKAKELLALSGSTPTSPDDPLTLEYIQTKGEHQLIDKVFIEHMSKKATAKKKAT